MDDPLKGKLELQAIRREVAELRKQFEILKRHDPMGFIAKIRGFDYRLLERGPIGSGNRIMHRYALDQIERQAEALEKRVDELEKCYGVGATLN
jgi:hypothetical protein